MKSLIRTIGCYDAKRIAQDKLIVMMVVLTILTSVVLRVFLPWINDYVVQRSSGASTAARYYPAIVAYFIVFQTTLIGGTIFDFMFIDEKEAHTIKALLVTPMPFHRYLIYRMWLSVLATFCIIIAMMPTVNQVLVPLPKLLFIALGASSFAPLVALFYPIVAHNKIQAVAYAKIVGIVGLLIPVSWFIKELYQWLFGFFPPFWISKGYWMALEEQSLRWLAILLGMIFQCVVIAILSKVFYKVACK